jgi:HlyD family secretion protein
MNDSVMEETQEITSVLEATSQGSPIKKYLRWAGIAIVLLIVVVIALGMARGHGKKLPPSYLTEAVSRGDLRVAVSATGNLKPITTVEVGSEMSGTIETVLVDVNDHVKKGQVLARIDLTKLTAQINQSKAALAVAEAKLRQTTASVNDAKANLARMREVSRLSGGKVPSKSDMQTAETTLERALADEASARASVSQSSAALKTDETNLYKGSIRSSIDGVVLSRSVEPGQTVAAGFQVATLFTLAEDLSEMKLQVDVDEADVGSVKQDQNATFTVDAYPNRKYQAKVTRVAYGSQTKDNVVSYPTLLMAKNKDLSLRPGMTATAEIISAERQNVLLVPNAALRFTPSASHGPAEGGSMLGRLMPRPPEQEKKVTAAKAPTGSTQTVWVLRDGKAVPVSVTVGVSDGRFTEVLSGDLKESMKVITDNAVPTK